MSWEEKVSSLLRDTETNLSRVKTKFGPSPSFGKNDTSWKYTKLSNTMPLKKYSSLLDLGSNGRHNTSLLDNTNTFKSPAPLRLSGFSDTLSTIQPVAPLMTTSLSNTLPLQEKLDQQNKLIDQLMQMVHKLDSERNNYNEQIRDIKGTLSQINGRGMDRLPYDPAMDRRLEQVRRELTSEIHSLQNQLHAYKASGNTNYDVTMNNLSREVHDIKHSLRDEMETVKRDLDILRSRVLKLEIDMPSSTDTMGNRSPDRSAARIEAALRDVHFSPMKSTTMSPISSKPMTHMTSSPYKQTGYHIPQDQNKAQLTDIRQTLTNLESKVVSMESSLNSHDRTPRSASLANGSQDYKYAATNGNQDYKYAATNGHQDFEIASNTRNGNGYYNEYYNPGQESALRLDDLNLSDEESTSLDTFGAESLKLNHKKKTVKIDNGELKFDDDEDLDLDDLDLSDDGTLSLDSEQLDSAHF